MSPPPRLKVAQAYPKHRIEMMARKEHSYDSACEILAEYFLGTNAERDAVEELAQHVQDAVEDWLRDVANIEVKS